jgi:signal transduction histidine kinase
MWRTAGADPGAVLDVGLAIAGVGLTAVAAWASPGLIGTVIDGPPWLLAVLPLAIGAPLAWRRRAPLLMWIALWAAVTLQASVTWKAPSGLELMFALFVGSYSLAAYSSLRRAVAGLAVTAPGAVIYIWASHGIGTNPAFVATRLAGPYDVVVSGGSHNAAVFLVGEILACWLVGVFVRARREAAALAEGNAALQEQAEQAVAAERDRIARELHDIVAHHLSVVVLQAAGARASGRPTAGALQKIEHSGRQALTEMRRLLGVLRDPRDETGLTPQPGVGELAALAESVRAAGLPVHLTVDGGHAALPAAVDVSAYRIVQEALTNVLKHAGPAHAEVTVGCADGALTIEVTDDGSGTAADSSQAAGSQAWGQGLVGMRERAAIFGGELLAGPHPGGGFAVRARLPLGDGPLGDGPLGETPPPALPGVVPAPAVAPHGPAAAPAAAPPAPARAGIARDSGGSSSRSAP